MVPEEVTDQRNESVDESEPDSSCRLDNTAMIKSAMIGKDDKDKRKRRRELMDYDDRQRTIKLINNFSEEQINRFVFSIDIWTELTLFYQVRDVQKKLLPEKPDQTLDDDDHSLHGASAREHSSCWNCQSFRRRACRRGTESC